ncbi:MAG: response regulator [Anaerolineales bacterium]
MTAHFALVIEDDPDLSEIFSKSLTAAGYTTEIIVDGQDGLTRVMEASDVSLIALDLHLPRVSGEKILEAMKKNPNLATTRLIIVTADTVSAELLRDKADVVLVKPVSYGQLRDISQRFLPR